MINNKCSSCGAKVDFLNAFFASRSFPITCRNCGEKQFRRHDLSNSLAYFGASIGVFALLYILLAQGMQRATILFVCYLCLLFLLYVLELFVFDLSVFGNKEINQVAIQSKRNIWIAITTIFFGVIFYVFDM